MANATSPNGSQVEAIGREGAILDSLRKAERHLLLALAELHAATGTDEASPPILHVIGGSRGPWAVRTLERGEDVGVQGIEAGALAVLTQRELSVLRLVAQHQTDKEIASALAISPRTVGAHVCNILRKLGVESRRGAMNVACQHGLG
jgi:DNA-binding NarL/FixJ family response regulator